MGVGEVCVWERVVEAGDRDANGVADEEEIGWGRQDVQGGVGGEDVGEQGFKFLGGGEEIVRLWLPGRWAARFALAVAVIRQGVDRTGGLSKEGWKQRQCRLPESAWENEPVDEDEEDRSRGGTCGAFMEDRDDVRYRDIQC